MTTVTLTIPPSAPLIDQPAGKTFGNWRIGITGGGSIVAEHNGPEDFAIFEGIAPGIYGCFYERRAVEGGQIGPTVEGPLTVPASVLGAPQGKVAGGALLATFS